MSILHRDEHRKGDSTNDVDPLVSVSTIPSCDKLESYNGSYPGVRRQPHSASTVTMTESRAGQPLSASTTIRDFTATDTEDCDDSIPDIEEPSPEDDAQGLAALSPTLPAPSPLPEDSPHKYGLRDQLDTPEVPEVTDTINLPKARRKSSGLEIFTVSYTLMSIAATIN